MAKYNQKETRGRSRSTNVEDRRSYVAVKDGGGKNMTFGASVSNKKNFPMNGVPIGSKPNSKTGGGF